MSKNYPKILFLDASLDKTDSTGITLSNLFSEWPADKIYFIRDPKKTFTSNETYPLNVYLLNDDDFHHRAPVGFFLRLIKGLKKLKFIVKRKAGEDVVKTSFVFKEFTKSKSNISIKLLVDRMFIYFGFDHLFFRQIINNRLSAWINKIEPDYLYVVLSTRHSILFAKEAVSKFKLPLIIHIMDDWPAVIGGNCMLPKYWNKKIVSELKNLLNISTKRIAISQKMAEEYEDKYGGQWHYLHNSVNHFIWNPHQKVINRQKKITKPKIGYFGRIGKANADGLISFILALEILNTNCNINSEVHIFSNYELPLEIRKLEHVVKREFVVNTKVPEYIKHFDFLVIPLTFNSYDLKFARLSIPTKLSEYFYSGVPTVIISPKETALAEYATINKCALTINSNDPNIISRLFLELIVDIDLQVEISENAKKVAQDNFTIKSTTNKILSTILK